MTISRFLAAHFDSIVRSILTEWVWLEDLVCLDSAYCQRAFRVQFLVGLPLIEIINCTMLNSPGMNWLQSKGIFGKSIRVLQINDLFENFKKISDPSLASNRVSWNNAFPISSELMTTTQFNVFKNNNSMADLRNVFCLDAPDENGSSYGQLTLYHYDEKGRSAQSISPISSTNFGEITTSMTHLGVLKLRRVVLDCSRWSMLVSAIGRSLYSIEFFDCNIDDSVLQGISQQCPELDSLVLMGCNSVTDAGIIAVYDKLPSLRLLETFDPTIISDKTLYGIGNDLTNLTVKCDFRSLIKTKTHRDCSKSLVYCSNVSVVGRSFSALFQKSPSLMSVTFERQDGVTDKVIEQLVEQCPLLTSISILDCRAVTSNCLYSLAECSDLVSLSLSKVDKLSDALIGGVLSGRPNFFKLALSSCTGYTGEVLSMIACQCPEIHHVDVSYNKTVVDEEVLLLLQKCSKILSLNVKGCVELSPQGLWKIEHHMTSGCLLY